MADIELVIKISEDSYKATCNGCMLPTDVENVVQGIKNGIPLPKGHGYLKDQKDLAKSLYDYQWIDQQTYIEVANRLIDTPTIIEADKEQENGTNK